MRQLRVDRFMGMLNLPAVFLILLGTGKSIAGSYRMESEINSHNRVDAIVRLSFSKSDPIYSALSDNIDSLHVGQPVAWSLTRLDRKAAETQPVEVEKSSQGDLQLTWVEPGNWPSGTVHQWHLETTAPKGFQMPWRWVTTEDGQLELHHRDRGFVFRYQKYPVNQKNLPVVQERGAYIHPFLTPSGKLATGDFSPFHTHHRGFFLAYAKTKRGNLAPDFWNIHAGTAKIVADSERVEVASGPVMAKLQTRHHWQLREKANPNNQNGEVVLDESWKVAVYEIPGQPSWVWDLTSSQKPVGEDLELSKHRYGGMAYRGPEPFVKGKLDVLTSEGRTDRTTADQKPCKWFDLTGPVAETSSDYVGATMCDHPSNLRFPNVVRIHPVSLPFFSFVPAHAEALVLKNGQTYQWKYRTMVHDGRPNRVRDQALFDDFANPVKVHSEVKLTER